MKKKRVVVIGAGIAGVSAAYYLNQAGLDVTVLDKHSGTDNCSYGNAGMIVPSHIIPLSSPGIISKGLKWMLNPESPFYIRPRLSSDLLKWGWEFKKASTEKHVEESGPVLRDLLMKSRELLIQIEAEENLQFDFVKKGLFMFCNTQYGLDKEAEAAEKAAILGIPAEVLTADEVKKMESSLALDIIGATYFPKDAHLHPGKLMDQLKALLKERSVKFIPFAEVTDFRTEDGRIRSVKSTGQNIWEADHFIICTGAWSASLLKKLGCQLYMQAGKGYSISLSRPPKNPEYCGILAEKKVTMTPMGNLLRFGGTMEIVGTDKTVNQKKITGLKKSVCEYLPDFSMDDFQGHKIWTGLRPCPPDGLPYAGRFKGISNLYASTGHAMMGMSLAPSCGKLVTELITNGASGLDHPMISPDRFNR